MIEKHWVTIVIFDQEGAEYDRYGNNINRHKKNPVDTSNQTVVYPVLIYDHQH